MTRRQRQTNAPVFGRPDTVPVIRITSLDYEPLYLLRGAEYTYEYQTSLGSRLGVKFNDLFDDDHDRCFEFDAVLASITMEHAYDRTFRGRAFLVSVAHYTGEVTPETWRAEDSPTRPITACDPKTCEYGVQIPHRIGAPYVPPPQAITSEFRDGPQPVRIEFSWADQ